MATGMLPGSRAAMPGFALKSMPGGEWTVWCCVSMTT